MPLKDWMLGSPDQFPQVATMKALFDATRMGDYRACRDMFHKSHADFTEENVLFLVCCYDTIMRNPASYKAFGIGDIFIRAGSPVEINIASDVRRNVTAILNGQTPPDANYVVNSRAGLEGLANSPAADDPNMWPFIRAFDLCWRSMHSASGMKFRSHAAKIQSPTHAMGRTMLRGRPRTSFGTSCVRHLTNFWTQTELVSMGVH